MLQISNGWGKKSYQLQLEMMPSRAAVDFSDFLVASFRTSDEKCSPNE